MRNQVKIQKEWSQGTSIQQDTMHVLPKGGWGVGAVRTIGFKTSCSKCKSIAFYRSLGMHSQVETRRRGWGGGGGEIQRTIGFKIICSESNSITFYRCLGMRNQLETQMERSQGTSIQQNSMHYFSRGGSENNRFQNCLIRTLNPS